MAYTSYDWYLSTDINEPWAWVNVFSPEDCKHIIEICSSLDKIKAQVGSREDQKLNENYRKTNISWVPVTDNTKWIFERCTAAILYANDTYFKYDLHKLESLQFTCYDEHGSYYNKHVDSMYKSTQSGQRKLSFSIQLTDASEYEGGNLMLHYGNDGVSANKTQGTGSFFPSYTLHEVTPITSGVRYSLVGWCIGPRFK